jgi:hypothetical protein
MQKILQLHLNTLISQISNGKSSKKELVHLAQENPAETLDFFNTLPDHMKKSFHWLGDIATKYSNIGVQGAA